MALSFFFFVFSLGCVLASFRPSKTKNSKVPMQASLAWTSTSPLHRFDSSFVSVNIDTASLDARMDLTDPTLINIIRQLGDVWLRIGGTSSNSLVYDPNGPDGDFHGAHINDAYWRDLAKLQAATGASLLFGLPRQLNAAGKYDPSINATALWSTTATERYKVDGWSLGNELIGGSLNSKQYAADYETFATALKGYPAVGQKIFGPSAAGFPGAEALTPFMTATKNMVTAFTFHAYSFDNCSLDVYVKKTGVEHMGHYYSSYVNLRDAVAPGVPLVLEEAATQAGGGCEGLSDRFVSGFWWVHSIGMAAEAGIVRVHRQDVAGFSFNHRPSHYQLAGTAGWVNASVSGPLTPHPDWFATVLHKQLAGNAVLSSRLSADSVVNDSVAVHVWCAAAGAMAQVGAVTLSFVNMNENDVQLLLSHAASVPRVEYMMQPGLSSQARTSDEPPTNPGAPPTSLTSDVVLLNGNRLTVGKDGVLPTYPIPGKRVTDASNIVLPAWSYGFVVLEAVDATACKGIGT